MKRKIIIAASLLAAASVLASNAALAYEIEVRTDSFSVSASLVSDVNTERPTIQLLNGDKTEVIYMGEGTSQTNSDYTYTFSFETFGLPKTLETGNYILRIGGDGVETKETTIAFVNIIDKSDALNAVNEAEDKTAAVIENSGKLGIDTSAVEALPTEWKDVISDALAGIDLSNDGTEEQVNEKYEAFLESYTTAAEKAVIAGSDDKAAVAEAIENSEKLGLDKEGAYSKLDDKTAVAEALISRDLSPDITGDELKDEFDGAVLVCVINRLDHGSAREEFEKCAKSGLIDPDMSDFNALGETNKANVFKDLKKQGITDYTKLADAFEEIAASYKKQNTTTGGGGGGGSTGGGGGGGVIQTPPVPDTVTPTPSPEPETDGAAFTDMAGFEWAEEAVEELSRRGVVNGDGSGKFNPQNFITREEFAKIAVTAFDLYNPDAVSSFDDVPGDAWFYTYVSSARESGVVTGISDTQFGAGNNITRQDMAVMLKRILDMTGISADNGGASFADEESIADYAREAVRALSGLGVLNGMDDGRFAPGDSVTRAQSAKAVYELLKITEG